MFSDRTVARLTGALFVTTMLAGIVDSVLALPVLGGGLATIQAHRGEVLAGVFLVLYMALGVVGLALLLQQVLKRYSPLIAGTYLTFRIIEAVFLIAGVLASFFVLALTQNASALGTEDSGLVGVMAVLAVKLRFSAYQISMLILGLNSVFLCGLLFVTRLVPRWLAGLGIVGYLCLFVSAVLDLCSVLASTGAGAFLYIPGGLFELVLFPVWLWMKGFNPDSKAPEAPAI